MFQNKEMCLKKSKKNNVFKRMLHENINSFSLQHETSSFLADQFLRLHKANIQMLEDRVFLSSRFSKLF